MYHAAGSGYWVGSRSHALASLIGPRPAVLRRARPVLSPSSRTRRRRYRAIPPQRNAPSAGVRRGTQAPHPRAGNHSGPARRASAAHHRMQRHRNPRFPPPARNRNGNRQPTSARAAAELRGPGPNPGRRLRNVIQRQSPRHERNRCTAARPRRRRSPRLELRSADPRPASTKTCFSASAIRSAPPATSWQSTWRSCSGRTRTTAVPRSTSPSKTYSRPEQLNQLGAIKGSLGCGCYGARRSSCQPSPVRV